MTNEIQLTIKETGHKLCFPSFEANQEGVDYIRVCRPDGSEIAYWSSDEWKEEPMLVLGAIMGALMSDDNLLQET